MTDLLRLAAGLVDIPSESHHEAALAAHVFDLLVPLGHLEVERVGDSVVARTSGGRERRILLGGHLDTVPPFEDAGARIEGDVLWGLGAVDMKGGLAVLLDLACSVSDPALDVTFVFYACEEVDRKDNQLRQLAAQRPELLRADAAVLAEPTGGRAEAGCQGSLRARVTLAGLRAHTARPHGGVNAIHRLAPVLALVADTGARDVVIDGCTYREQLQAVGVGGGIAGNVVPDRAELLLNMRFAPDRDAQAAYGDLGKLLAPVLDEGRGDSLELLDASSGAPPCLGDAILQTLVRATGSSARAKLGWTDVATLWELGVPAINFGPGNPELAHTPGEHVSAAELDDARRVLRSLLGAGDAG